MREKKDLKTNQQSVHFTPFDNYGKQKMIYHAKRRNDDTVDPNVKFFIVLLVIFLIAYLYFCNFYFVVKG